MDDSFSRYKDGERLLFESLVDNPNINSILNLATQVTGNPFVFFDNNFQVFNLSTNIEIDSPIWNKLTRRVSIENLFLTKELFILEIEKNETLDLLNLPNEKHVMIRNQIYIDNKLIGSLGTIDFIQPFSENDVDFINYLKKILIIRLHQQQFYRSSKGTTYENFFYILLKDPLNADSIKLRQKIYNIEFDGTFVVLVIDLNNDKSNGTPLEFIQRHLKDIILNAYSIIYNNRIIFIINIDRKLYLNKKLEKQISMYLKANTLTGSISNPFTDMSMFRNQYRQAVEANRIIIFRKLGAGLFYYKDFILDYLFILGESIVSPINFRHPAIDALKEYDNENNTEYLFSLRTYIQNLGNMAESARILNIHYNTMKYRVKVIQDIVPLDLKNPSTLISIYITFKIDEGMEDIYDNNQNTII